jgi:alkylation response protein AidB-like acyl-CoA dehydrogenase
MAKSAGNQVWLDSARTVAHDVLAPHAAEVDPAARWPAESIAALAQAKLMSLTIPRELGGAGEGPTTFAQVTRLLAEECASTAMIYLMHTCGVQLLLAAKEFAQRDTVLKSVVAGRHLTTLAFSEKGSRSHFWAPVSQAVREGAQVHLTAEKSWVTSAGHADSYVVSTRAAGRSDPLASTLYYVPKDAAGLTIGSAWDGMGLRGNASSPMRLERVVVGESQRLSPEAEGFGVMLNTVLPWFQLGSAAVSVGIARAATEGTKQHLLAAKLEHLGQPLSSLPNLRARLAQMQIATDSQQVFLGHVAAAMENPDPATMLAVLQSKAGAAETALQVTDLAMRTCGGAAFSRHLGVERNFRDARAASVMAPTTDVLYDFIGKSLLGLPLL